MKQFVKPFITYCILAPTAHAAISISSPSTAWTPLLGNYDYFADQQTGSASGDIVGTATDPGMLFIFDDNGTAANHTDGSLGFRLRLDTAGGNTNNPAFDRVAWIGIDADLNGSVDVFMGLNLQGSNSEVGVYAPGTGANTSPSTTSIAAASVTYPLTSTNFNYRPVDFTTDGGTTNDVTTAASGDIDYYASFMVPFSDVIAFLSTKSIQITDQSPLRFVSATSTQTNSLNQDLGGVNGGVNSTTTWVDLGGFTNTVSIPEPSSSMLLVASLSGAMFIRRRR